MSASSKKKLRKELEAAVLTEKQLKEKKEAKGLKIATITFVVIMALVVCIALFTAISKTVARSGYADRKTVAATVGDHKISSAELNYFYVDAINNTYRNWQNQYGDYTSATVQAYLGLDLTKSLASQMYDAESATSWADYFVATAIDSVKSTYALCDKAAAEGFTLSEEDQKTLEYNIGTSRMYAVYYGYEDLAAYLKAVYGFGATEESYLTYCEHNAIAASYYKAHSDTLTYDDAAIRAYDAEHAREYNAYTYASYYLSATSFLEGGTVDENGKIVYSDEEKDAAREQVKVAAESLLNAASVTELDKAIASLSINKGSTDQASTKNENYLYSKIGSTIRDWVTDPSRTAGDATIIENATTTVDADGKEVKVINGYTVVFFQNCTENTQNLVNVRHILVAFQGGTKDASGSTVYSDEEKAAARSTATDLLYQWRGGEATEDSFAALATEKTMDNGSKDAGGLYENVYPGQMVPAFNDWCFDEARHPGDTGIVESTYGYHVMYYVGTAPQTYRDYMIENDLRSADMQTWYDALLKEVTVNEGNTSRLNRDLVIAQAR